MRGSGDRPHIGRSPVLVLVEPERELQRSVELVGLAVGERAHPPYEQGLCDRQEVVGSPLGARVVLLTWFGGDAATNRVRSFLAGRPGHGIGDLEIEAQPAASAGDLVGDAILRRANYHFAIRRRESKG